MRRMPQIEKVLVQRDKISQSEAMRRVQYAIEELEEQLYITDLEFINIPEFCERHFGLEADYFRQIYERTKKYEIRNL